MATGRTDLSANVERFTGFADCYDAYRPQPPAVVPEILCRLARVQRPRLVVDLGSGTGLSTCLWAGRADEVIGIDPSEDMRRRAAARTAGLPEGGSIRYQAGFSSDTGLPDGCADIVTCSQSLHWMDPEPTFAEVARILRPGGVFAAYDCDWPPALDWEAEAAYVRLMDRVRALEKERRPASGVRGWAKGEHLGRIEASDRFRYVREITLHHVDTGDAERLVGVARSQGGVQSLLKAGLTEAEIGLDDLRAAAEQALGGGGTTWYWSYRLRLGVR